MSDNLDYASQTESLSGQRLTQYLDDIQDILTNSEEGGMSSELQVATLKKALTAQVFAPNNAQQVFHLSYLWMRAESFEQAEYTLLQDGSRIKSSLPDEQQAYFQLEIDHSYINLLARLKPTMVHEALVQQLTKLTKPFVQICGDEELEFLAQHAQDAKSYDLLRDIISARHMLCLNVAERDGLKAWDESVKHARLAQSYAAQGDTQQVIAHTELAYQVLSSDVNNPSIDQSDWVNIGHILVLLNPDLHESICQHVERLSEPGLWEKAATQIKSARLHACAYAAKGELKKAVEIGMLGRVYLTHDNGDDQTVKVMQWLLALKDFERLGEIGFETVNSERETSSVYVYQLAKRLRLEQPDNAWWPLILARASLFEDAVFAEDNTSLADYVYMQLAEAKVRRGEACVFHDLILGLYLIRAEQNYARALPLLERVASAPQLLSPDISFQLILARSYVLGSETASALPVLALNGSTWYYSMGVEISDINDELPQESHWSDSQIEAVSEQYYEHGLARYERFLVNTADAGYPDLEAHTYSMMCNNYAICCRSAERYEQAKEYHDKGIAASPFAEHYDGLLSCSQKPDDNSGYISAAESLWQFSEDYGYSRHSPQYYFPRVVNRLYQEDRDAEIGIWVQRLEQWWESLNDEQDEEGVEAAYWQALIIMLTKQAWSQKEDVLLRAQSIPAKVKDIPDPELQNFAGRLFEKLEEYEIALSYFDAGLEYAKEGPMACESEALEIAEKIKALEWRFGRNTQGRDKPWWKFW